MPDDPSNQSDPRIETGSRAQELPEEAHIRKRFDKFQDFVDMYRSRISLGGAFIDVEILRPVGTEVYLDFRLEDGYRLLYGLAEVVWVRLKTMSDERPKGMGLRFLSLDEGGRELVLKLLEEQVKSGGAPFEVDRVPEDGSIDPTVVQAMAGPSAEENEAAQKAKTGSRPAQQPDSEADEDSGPLPDLPPGVLPPPDEEADFSAPWGEQLPEIPDELLEESAAAPAGGASPEASSPSIPGVEAPESPYAPGSDTHDDADSGDDSDSVAAVPEPAAPAAPEQSDFTFDPPADGGDPHLDETDFGASAWGTSSEDESGVKSVGGVTDLQQAQGDPFSDFDSDSVPEVDGTLFQLPDSSPAAADEPAAVDAAPESPASAASLEPTSEEPAFEVPSFDAPSFDAPSFDGAAADEDSDAGTFDAGGFEADAFDGVDFGDDSASQVAPPPDVGDGAGSAWQGDPPELGSSETSDDSDFEVPAVFETPAPSSQPDPPQPTPEETAAMDAAMDIDDDFAFEPPDADLLDESEAEQPPKGDRSDIATPESVAAAALAEQMNDSQFETQPTPTPAESPSTTDTADDLFAFRGPADAQPALDPEETASLRKGALPDLSDTMMGTKKPVSQESAQDDGEELHESYDDWEEWAPHPTKSKGRTKTLIGVVLLLVLVGGASYFFRSTLLPMVGFGGGADPAPLGPPPTAGDPAAGDPAAGDPGVEEYEPPRDPLAEPVETAEPDSEADPSAGAAEEAPDTTDERETQATADSLRPPSIRPDPPSAATSPPPPQQTVPPRQSPSAQAAPPPARDTARPTGRAASRIEGIDVRSASGTTEVIIRMNGDVGRDRYTHDKLAWAPDKEMVTLLGFENFEQTEIAGRGSHLRRIRVGFHPGKELRLVFDLTSGAVGVQDVRAQGNQLIVRLSN